MEVTCLRPAVNFNNSIVLSSCPLHTNSGCGKLLCIAPLLYCFMFSLLQHDRIDKMFNRFFPVPGCYLDVGVVKKKNVVLGVACLDKPSRIREFFLGLPLLYTLSLVLLQTSRGFFYLSPLKPPTFFLLPPPHPTPELRRILEGSVLFNIVFMFLTFKIVL